MLKICVLLLFIFCVVESARPRNMDSCPTPKLKNGRVRVRQRGRMVRFFCLPGFQLIGNRYASCQFGQWDEEIPVCIKSGCDIRNLENGIQWRLHDDAWIVSFCFAGYELKGSSILYCDGFQWNGTFPTCVDTTTQPELSCDFEKDLCGWTDDELHDFDWRRLNRRTPSSFLRTGPSFDHTLGEGKSGYYMYIESTSRSENDTARLISPVYSSSLAINGCFSFFYHMFGRTIGGLKVYQKPESMPNRQFVALPEREKQKYTLFEEWGNQGDIWLRDVSKLTNFNDSFQIVIEGIRGSSFTSDIAIDDVAILQGDACNELMSTTPLPPADGSCLGRCDLMANIGPPSPGDPCGCSIACSAHENCCADFLAYCIFADLSDNSTETSTDISSQELPQTQKLVAVNTTLPDTTSTTISTTTKRHTITPSSTTKLTTLPTTKPTTTSTTTSTIRTTITTKSTTTKKATVTAKPVVKTTAKVVRTTTKVPATTKPTTTLRTTKVVPITTKKNNGETKYEKEQSIEKKGGKTNAAMDGVIKSQHKSSTKSIVLTLTVILICACIFSTLLLWRYRGARTHHMIARLRGRVSSDPEVRYLSADTDD